MRIENPELYDQRFSRRGFLVLSALSAAYAGTMIYDRAIPRFFPSAPEAKNLEADFLKAGVTAIYKGINIRTSPRIPSKTRFRQPDNRLTWEQIEEVNGTPINNQSAFIILNPLVVEGQAAYKDYNWWIKIMVKKIGQTVSQSYYINLSPNTNEHVKFLGFAGFADQGEETYQLYGSGYKVKRGLVDLEDIERVIIPPDPKTMASDIMPSLWAERMKQKFANSVSSGDKIVKNLKIVAAGSNQDIEEMVRNETPINLREYPSLEYGNGEPVKVVDRIPQGTLVDKVLIPPDDYSHFNFAAVMSEDINGPLLDAQGNIIEPTAGRVCAIYMPYLARM